VVKEVQRVLGAAWYDWGDDLPKRAEWSADGVPVAGGPPHPVQADHMRVVTRQRFALAVVLAGEGR
jgi:hypothetical protein